MKNLIKNLKVLALLILIISFSSCIKNRNAWETDFGGIAPIVQIAEAGLPGSPTFASSAISFPGSDAIDSMQYYLNYANSAVAASDVTVTLSYSDAALTAYNASNTIQYTKLPDSCHAPITSKVVVKAGQSYSSAISFIVYPSKMDPSQNYMYPITITDAQGNAVSGNFSTIYYHAIGNPLAGTYKWSYYRWNGTTDTTTAPNSTVATNVTLSVPPITPTSVFLEEYYIGANFGYTSYGTTLQFSYNGTPSNFSTFFDAASLKVLTDNSFSTPTNGSKLVKAILVGSGATHYSGTTIRTYTEFVNSSGAVRAMIDNYVKQ